MFKIIIFSSLLVFLVACKKRQENPTPSDFVLTADSQVTDKQGNIYKVGFDQVTSINQDPFVEKRNSSGALLWKISHEATPPDGRAVFVTLDENDIPYVTFSVDGGSTDNNFITKKEIETNAFSNVFLAGYGKGGGPKVAIIARLNPTNGKITKATFLTSRTAEGNHNVAGNTNSFEITRIGVRNGICVVDGNSWFKPAGANATESNFLFHTEATDANKHGSYWKLRYEFPIDFSKINASTIIKP